MSWELVGAVAVFLMAPFVTLNPILYAYVHDWRKSSEGRALMHMFISLALLVDLTVAFDLLPGFPGKSIIAALVIGALLIGSVRFTAILVRELRAQRPAKP